MDSMFTERNPNVHKALKSPVAQIFSMTNMRNFEVYADECTTIFLDAMRDLEGQRLDLAQWLQWYAFDVIGGITFQRRFGFLERRHDVDEMIGKINHGLEFVKIIGQSEWMVALFDRLHANAWIRENYWPDTMDKFLKVRTLFSILWPCCSCDAYSKNTSRSPRRNWTNTIAAQRTLLGQTSYPS